MMYVMLLLTWLCTCSAEAVVDIKLHSAGIGAVEEAVVDIKLHSAGSVSPAFLSLALDSNLIKHKWDNFNMSSPRLMTLAHGLSPAYLRVGGTQSSFLLFDPSPDATSTAAHTDYDNFTLSAADWLKLNTFTQEVRWDLIFGLNILLRKGDSTEDDVWDPTNAKQLLDFSAKHNFSIDWELGNEPNHLLHWLNRSVEAHQLATDFQSLRKILNGYDLYKTSKLLGPDVTHPVYSSPSTPALQYLDEFLSSAMDSVQAVTFHQYNLEGSNAKPEDFLNVTLMDTLTRQIRAVTQIVDAYGGGAVVLGETAGASGGGAEGLDNSYISGFLWLDKLGTAALEGVQIVIRQTIYYGRYALIDNNLEPRPDYWLSYVYKTLVGEKVLEVDASDSNIRLYAHCSKTSPGGVVVFGMNLMTTPAAVLLPALLSSSEMEEYLLAPCSDQLTDTCVMLNDNTLELVGETLPMLQPVHKAASSTLKLQSRRLGFYVFPQANDEYCLDKK